MAGYNKAIVKLVEERLEIGKREYNQQVDVHDGRNWTQESLEEALDLAVYLSAEILKRKTKKYNYLATARVSDRENGPYYISSSRRLNWTEIQEDIAKLLIGEEPYLGSFGTDIYIDTVFVLCNGELIKTYLDGHCTVDVDNDGKVVYTTSTYVDK